MLKITTAGLEPAYRIPNSLVFPRLPLLSLGKFRENLVQDPPSTCLLSMSSVPEGTQISGKYLISWILRYVLILLFIYQDLTYSNILDFRKFSRCPRDCTPVSLFSYQLVLCLWGSHFTRLYLREFISLPFGASSATQQLCGFAVFSGPQCPHPVGRITCVFEGSPLL